MQLGINYKTNSRISVGGTNYIISVGAKTGHVS